MSTQLSVRISDEMAALMRELADRDAGGNLCAYVRALLHSSLRVQGHDVPAIGRASPHAPREGVPPEDAHPILREVADRFGVSLPLMLGRSKRRRASLARQVAMYRMRHETSMTLDEIGRHFGRDHTTIIRGCNRVQDLIDAYGEKALPELT